MLLEDTRLTHELGRAVMRRLALLLGGALGVFGLALILSAVGSEAGLGPPEFGKTPPFRGPHREVLSGSIAETEYRRLGGLDQRVMIRGKSIANPLVILLHGGPGLSETGLFRHFNAPLEESFTVVYWDPRFADILVARSAAITLWFGGAVVVPIPPAGFRARDG